MTYSTGSGTYTDLMAAVLAHAVTDGWTTTGGNWPISKGNVRGVNWATRTVAASDYTSGITVPITERIIDLAIGTSGADSTARAAVASGAQSVQIRGMQYTISEWFIFSNPAAFNYIHVALRYSNGFDPEVYQHFSFGEVDKGGFTYGAVAYVAASARRPYAALAASTLTNTNNSYDWNCGVNSNWPNLFSGKKGYTGGQYRMTAGNTICFIISPTTSPTPAIGDWLQPDVLGTQDDLLDAVAPFSAPTSNKVGLVANSAITCDPGMNFIVATANAHPYSGGISLASLPVILTRATVSSPGMFLGVFPDVRVCSIQTFATRDEVSYAADTWKLLPLLKKTDWSQTQESLIVSSGETGYAYKKVV